MLITCSFTMEIVHTWVFVELLTTNLCVLKCHREICGYFKFNVWTLFFNSLTLWVGECQSKWLILTSHTGVTRRLSFVLFFVWEDKECERWVNIYKDVSQFSSIKWSSVCGSTLGLFCYLWQKKKRPVKRKVENKSSIFLSKSHL